MLTFGFQKEKEDLEEVSTELELSDEDDKVPYVSIPNLLHWQTEYTWIELTARPQVQDWRFILHDTTSGGAEHAFCIYREAYR